MRGFIVAVAGLVMVGLSGLSGAEDRQLDHQIEREKLAVEWLGIVRHFHPTEAVETADWEGVLFDAMTMAREMDQGAAFQDALIERLEPLTAGMKVGEQGFSAPEMTADCRDDARPLRWDHKGFGAPPAVPLGNEGEGPRVYESQRAPWPEDETGVAVDELPSAYRLDIGAGREVLIPLSLCPEVAAMEESGGERSEESSLPDDLPPSDLARLSVASLWPVLRHFYPYPEVVEEEWDDLLLEALHKAGDADDRKGVKHAIATLTVAIRDGHVRITDHQARHKDHRVYLELHWTDGQPHVIASSDESAVPEGARITAVDGEPLDHWRRNALKQSSGSEQWRQHRLTHVLWGGHEGETLSLAWEKDGETGEGNLVYGEGSAVDPRQRDPLEELSDGIAYADLRATGDDMIDELIEHLADREAAVLDLRGYPAGAVGFRILAHLVDEDFEPWQDWMRVMTPLGPNGEQVVREAHGWPIQAMEPRIDARLVVLMDYRAISYAESVLGFIKNHELATLIGEASAGSNGNVMALALPGGFTISMTGMRVIGPDGEIFQGRGIQPDIEVRPSVSGLLEGRDEVLEAALEYLDGESSISH